MFLKNIFIGCFLFHSRVLLNNQTNKASIWVVSKLRGQNVPLRPPFQTICARLSAKTPASSDLQISPEIEESVGREILKQSGACFLPSPDPTCPIWVFSSDLFSVFLFFVPQICPLPGRSLFHTLFN